MCRFISILLLLVLSFTAFCQAPSTSPPINQMNANGKAEGLWILLDVNRQPYVRGIYENGKPVDTLFFYKDNRLFLKRFKTENSELKFLLMDTNTELIQVTKDGKTIYQLQDGSVHKDSDQFSGFLQMQARFPGSPTAFKDFQKENLKYPRASKKKKIQGPVTVNFLIKNDGSVDYITIEKSLNEECDNEVIRMLKLMPKWQPSFQRGMPVHTRMRTTIQFTL